MSEEAVLGSTVVPPPVGVDEGRLNESSRGRVAAVLIIIVLLSEIIPFAYTLAGLVTPLIGRSFPSAGNSLTWSITIVGVAGGATIALVTKAADLWGKKRMMLISCVIFTAGTLICALTGSWALFLAGRGMEAIAVGMSALCYSLIRDIMPRSWVPVAIGFIGTGFGVSAIAGPLIGGLLTDHFSWRSVFWFMVIYMAVTVPLFAAFVPESPVRARSRLDVSGVLLIGGGLAAVLVYISEGASWGWTSPDCYGYLIGGLVALALFLVRQRLAAAPVIDLALLRSPRLLILLASAFFFTGVVQIASFIPSFMLLVGKKQVEQGVIAAGVQQSHLPASVVSRFITFRGDIDYAAGFSLFQLAWHALVWQAVVAMIFGPVAALVSRRIGARRPLIVGAVIFLVVMAGLSIWHGSWVPLAIFGAVMGIPFGVFYAAVPNMLVDVVPRRQQAISAGLFAASGSIGGAFATSIATAIFISHPFQVVATEPTGKVLVTNIPQVYTSAGYGQAYLLVGVIGAAMALILAVVMRTGRTPAQGGAPELD
jgi:MFS family permease